ncbi:MAG: Gfo/Idh/MocA family oxidoreductase [Candidatus Omnitrophota bacterium]|nr:Gfo/Idh/MocA family oxidoreductase [Candidatus Omnitrophota bacterium]
MDKKKINIGIIGCGHWGPNFVRNFYAMPGLRVAGVCDSNPEKLAHLKEVYNDINTYDSYSDLLNNDEVNALVISTPASTHYKITKEALARGKHVLVEKPLSLKLTQAQELLRISRRIKKVLMVGHTFLFNPAVNKIKEIIDKRRLGRIYYIHCRRTNLGPLRKDVNAIWDLSPHDISIVNYILGRMPLEVSAYSQRFLAHRMEDVGFIILKYPKNILVHIHVSWLDPKKIRETTIIGSKKMLVYEDTNAAEPIRIYDKQVMRKRYEKTYKDFKEFQLIIRDGRTDIPGVSSAEPLKLECRHFIDCINSGARPLTDVQGGVAVLRVLKAVDKSLDKKGRFVKIP